MRNLCATQRNSAGLSQTQHDSAWLSQTQCDSIVPKISIFPASIYLNRGKICSNTIYCNFDLKYRGGKLKNDKNKYIIRYPFFLLQKQNRHVELVNVVITNIFLDLSSHWKMCIITKNTLLFVLIIIAVFKMTSRSNYWRNNSVIKNLHT